MTQLITRPAINPASSPAVASFHRDNVGNVISIPPFEKNPVRFIPLLVSCLVLATKFFRFLASVFCLSAALAADPGRPTSDPYKGDLSIFESPDRAEKLQINRVMDLLGIKRGSAVADIGAGSGWFTVRFARRVGSGGVIYAVEVNPDYIRHIQARAKAEKLPNIRAVLGKEDDPLLGKASVNAVLLLKTYHEIAQPISLLGHVRDAMRPGAKLGIIDRNGNGSDHGLNAEVVVKEAAEAGFKLAAKYDFVKADGMDYFLVFQCATR